MQCFRFCVRTIVCSCKQQLILILSSYFSAFYNFLVIEHFITMDYLTLSICHLGAHVLKELLSRTFIAIQHFDPQWVFPVNSIPKMHNGVMTSLSWTWHCLTLPPSSILNCPVICTMNRVTFVLRLDHIFINVWFYTFELLPFHILLPFSCLICMGIGKNRLGFFFFWEYVNYKNIFMLGTLAWEPIHKILGNKGHGSTFLSNQWTS